MKTARESPTRRLTDLAPKWLLRDGRRVGFVFICPSTPDEPTNLLCVLFDKMVDADQYTLLKDNGINPFAGCTVELSESSRAWTSNGAGFDALSVWPEIGDTFCARWRGWIADGDCLSARI